jgi:hypothetical protein
LVRPIESGYQPPSSRPSTGTQKGRPLMLGMEKAWSIANNLHCMSRETRSGDPSHDVKNIC